MFSGHKYQLARIMLLVGLVLSFILTVLLATEIPPAKVTFFQVAMMTCFGSNVSVPTLMI